MKLGEFAAEVEPSEGQNDYEVVIEDRDDPDEEPYLVTDVRWDHKNKQVVISF